MAEKKSKYRGVSWHKARRKWVAQICVNYKTKSLGYFITEQEAFAAYQTEYLKIYGKSISHIEPMFDYEANTVMIPLSVTKGNKHPGLFYATIDLEDYDKVKDYKWNLLKTKYINKYYAITSGGKVYMHKLILGQDNCVIDHKDNDGLNNRKNNLRSATYQKNQFNRSKSKNKTSIYKGVSFVTRLNKWVASITYNYKGVFLGNYDTEIAAAQAYDSKARELFGDFAKTNFEVK